MKEQPEKFKRGKAQKAVDHLGNEYESFSAMCRAYNISRWGVVRRLKSGMNIKQALTSPTTTKPKESTDHKGNVYRSFNAMCKAYNQRSHTVQCRLDRGESLEEALTSRQRRGRKGNKSIDHKGNEYRNFIEMCKAYNKDRKLVNNRVKRGWSLEEALTKPARKRNPNKIQKEA